MNSHYSLTIFNYINIAGQFQLPSLDNYNTNIMSLHNVSIFARPNLYQFCNFGTPQNISIPNLDVFAPLVVLHPKNEVSHICPSGLEYFHSVHTKHFKKTNVTQCRADTFIQETKKLDFNVTPCPNLASDITNRGSMFIPLHDRKCATENLKWSMVSLCGELGYQECSRKHDLMYAIICHYSYVHGYKKPMLTVTYFRSLWKVFQDSLQENPSWMFDLFQSKSNKGRVSYIDFLCERYPTLLHELYCYAISVLDLTTKSIKLVGLMNDCTRQLYPECKIRSDLGMTVYHFWSFFCRFKGKLLAEVSKPRLTQDKRRMRLRWVKMLKSRLELNPEMIICFLDKKWFFSRTGQKK